MTNPLGTKVTLCIALLVTALAYWPGLHGPFLFDDGVNLFVLQSWLAGQMTWQEVVFGQQSLLVSRPVAMLSFMFNAAIGGGEPFSFKLGNLLIHLLTGLLAWQLLRQTLTRDPRLSAQASLIAAVITALWLLHPLHASTVLYAVQRMAQLSSLFTLAALWTYCVARQQLIDGHRRAATLKWFLLFPLLVAAGFFSKQNAATAPALCLVLELAYFRGQVRPQRLLQGFYTLFLWLPLAAGVALLLFAPQRLLGDYALYDFTLGQRLLTEPRVLMDYLGQLLIPRGPLMGLYTDDFSTSTGLLSPPSTLWAILVLAAISVFAIAVRRRAPSVFAGWWFFLVAHGMESSFLPLDLYFEHRNYLPAVGLLLAVAGLLALLPRQQFATNVMTPRQLGLLAAGGLALVFAFGTLGRALVWQDKYAIAEQGVKQHPHSLRAKVDLAGTLIDRGHQDYARLFGSLIADSDPRQRLVGNIYMLTFQCIHGSGDPALLSRIAADAQSRISQNELAALQQLVKANAIGHCGDMDRRTIADGIVVLLDKAQAQPENAQPKWLLRRVASDLYVGAEALLPALVQLQLAWHGSGDPNTGARMAMLQARVGQTDAARQTLHEAAARLYRYDASGRNAIANTRAFLAATPEDGGIAAPVAPAIPAATSIPASPPQ